jgi:signal peptidase II
MLLILLGYTLLSKSVSPSAIFAYALVFAGGVGNLIDRLMYDGFVIDFINIGVGSLRTGIFNVADVAVTLGLLIIMLGTSTGRILQPRQLRFTGNPRCGLPFNAALGTR